MIELFAGEGYPNTSKKDMTDKTKGFLRGLLYAVVATVLTYIGAHIGESGLVSTTLAAIITGIVGLIEHSINAPIA